MEDQDGFHLNECFVQFCELARIGKRRTFHVTLTHRERRLERLIDALGETPMEEKKMLFRQIVSLKNEFIEGGQTTIGREVA